MYGIWINPKVQQEILLSFTIWIAVIDNMKRWLERGQVPHLLKERWLSNYGPVVRPTDNNIPFLLWIFSWTLAVSGDSLSAMLNWVIYISWYIYKRKGQKMAKCSSFTAKLCLLTSYVVKGFLVILRTKKKKVLRFWVFPCSMWVCICIDFMLYR